MPGTEVAFVLYHDTLSGLPEGPITKDGRPFASPQVIGLYAPRERCYAHAIDDPNCPRNRYYWNALQKAIKVLQGRVDVFEYYGDTILWHYFNIAIPHVIAGDLRAYRRAGIRELQTLVFGTSSLWVHGLNLATVAWLSSGAESSVDAVIERYALERFGAAIQDRMVAYYRELEEVQASYLSFCTYSDEWMWDLRGFGTPSPVYPEHRRRVIEAKERFTRLATVLAEAVEHAKGDPFVANAHAEQASLAVTRVELDQLELRLSIAERFTGGGSAEWTEAETQQRIRARQRQWELAQTVPAAIRGQAFGALAP
jgi:hypothetical protein